MGSGAARAIPLMDICNGRADGHMQTDMFQPDLQGLDLLPSDGELNDFGRVFCGREADIILHRLLRDVPWQADTALVNGQVIKSGRQVAWYADDKFRYSHSGLLREAIVWELPILELIKNRVERVTGATFNSCVLNLYHNGSQGLGWHSDREAVGADWMPTGDDTGRCKGGTARRSELSRPPPCVRRYAPGLRTTLVHPSSRASKCL